MEGSITVRIDQEENAVVLIVANSVYNQIRSNEQKATELASVIRPGG